MNDGNEREFHGSASIGLLATKINLEGPIIKGKTTFVVSARRTYFDVLSPAIALVANEDDVKATGGYYFYDLNAKVTHRFSDRDKLYLIYYMGSDKVYVRMKEDYDSGSSYPDVRYVDREKLNLGWRWGNIVGAARWNHLFSNRLFMNATVNYTQYRHLMDVGMESITENGYVTTGLVTRDSSLNSLGYNSLINDLKARTDFEYKAGQRHDMHFGAAFTMHFFKPSVTTLSAVNSYFEDVELKRSVIDTTFGDKQLRTSEAAIYVEDDINVTDWLKFNLSLRYTYYDASGTPYHSLEPRAGARLLLTDDLSFKASYTRMTQYIHLLSNSSVSLPTDLWVPVTSRVKPMKSNQVAAGLYYVLGMMDFSVEGYWKSMDNVVEYRDGASFLGSSTGWEDKVAQGRGWAYGVELLVQKKRGKLTGWIGYTWSRTMRQFDREGEMINFGRVFPAKYDRIHDLSVTASYPVTARIDLNATFVFGSGTCGTLALKDIVAPEYDGQVWIREIGQQSAPVNYYELSYVEERNNYRMPAYIRVDAGVNFHRQFGNGHSRIINVSVYNLTNRNNPFLVYSSSKMDEAYNRIPILEQMSLFPIIPSISYCYKF